MTPGGFKGFDIRRPIWKYRICSNTLVASVGLSYRIGGPLAFWGRYASEHKADRQKAKEEYACTNYRRI